MKERSTFLVAFAVLAYCTWQVSDYVFTLYHGPLEANSWLVMIIWSAPILYYWIDVWWDAKPFQEPNLWLLMFALLTTLAGVLGSLNTLKYGGFALALSAFIPWSLFHIVWLPCAIAWMPALAWFSIRYFSGYLLLSRFLLAATSAFLVILATENMEEEL